MNFRTIAAGLLLVPATGLAGAMTPQSALAQIPSSARGPTINPGTLTNYAEAYLDIGEIDEDRATRVRAAQDSAEIGSI